MNEQPSVVCVMLTANRPEMARQAVECFRAQAYTAKRLFVMDTGRESARIVNADTVCSEHYPDVAHSIGELRNWANDWANDHCLAGDIIIHFDDDDWSHPNRIAEQVALLQSSGADVVGYNEMLFWKEPLRATREIGPGAAGYFGEAWLYCESNPSYALGTSLCYWRKTWERKPFLDKSHGEDLDFIRGLKMASGSSIGAKVRGEPGEPRMIARIHGANTSTAYTPKKMAAHPDCWCRVPEWDAHCRSVFA